MVYVEFIVYIFIGSLLPKLIYKSWTFQGPSSGS